MGKTGRRDLGDDTMHLYNQLEGELVITHILIPTRPHCALATWKLSHIWIIFVAQYLLY